MPPCMCFMCVQMLEIAHTLPCWLIRTPRTAPAVKVRTVPSGTSATAATSNQVPSWLTIGCCRGRGDVGASRRIPRPRPVPPSSPAANAPTLESTVRRSILRGGLCKRSCKAETNSAVGATGRDPRMRCAILSIDRSGPVRCAVMARGDRSSSSASSASLRRSILLPRSPSLEH
jgi:hypothetical protein